MPLTAKQDESVLRLSDVIKKGCFQQIRFLVDIGIDIDEKDGERRTPLMLCALMEPGAWGVGLAMLLIERGASIDSVDKYGMNALHYACVYERTDLVKVLLNAIDFDVNQLDRHGNTALHYAARSGHSGITSALVGTLRRYKLPLDKCNKDGRTPLEEAERLSHHFCADILRSSESVLGDDPESVRSRSPISTNLRTYRENSRTYRENSRTYRENSTSDLSRHYSSGSLLRSRTSLLDRRQGIKFDQSKPTFRRSETSANIYRKQPSEQLPANSRDENKLIRCASLSDFRNTLEYLFRVSPIDLFTSTSRNATPMQSTRPKTGFRRSAVPQNVTSDDVSWKTEFKILLKHYEYQCSTSYRPSARTVSELPHLSEKPLSPSLMDETSLDDTDNRKKGRRTSVMGKIGIMHTDPTVPKKKPPVIPTKGRKNSVIGQNVKPSIPVIDGALASSNESLNSNMSAKRLSTIEVRPSSPKTNVDKQSKTAVIPGVNTGMKKPEAASIPGVNTSVKKPEAVLIPGVNNGVTKPEATGVAVANTDVRKPEEKAGRVSRTGLYKSIPTVTVVDDEIDATSEGSDSIHSNVDPNYLHVLSDIDEQ